MKLITTDEQLRLLIPNVLATVEGEPTLIEKLYPYLETAEQWVMDTFVPETIFDEIAEADSSGPNERFRFPLEKLVACHAYMTAIPSLDLVLTPNGFGIVSNQTVVPASRERVAALINSFESQRDSAIESLLIRLSSLGGWQQSEPGKFFSSTLFPTLSLCHRLAIREHIWQSYQQLHARLIRIEAVLADTYFSHAQMQEFRQMAQANFRSSTPKQEYVIRTLQSFELQLLTDSQVNPQCYYDLITIIRGQPSEFPAWHTSQVAPLFTPAKFKNSKKSSAYWL